MRGLEVQTERRAGKGQEGNTTLQQGEGLGPAEQTRARSESPQMREMRLNEGPPRACR